MAASTKAPRQGQEARLGGPPRGALDRPAIGREVSPGIGQRRAIMLRALPQQVAAREMQPVEHFSPGVVVDAIERAALGPGRCDTADEAQAGLIRRQGAKEGLAGADFETQDGAWIAHTARRQREQDAHGTGPEWLDWAPPGQGAQRE